MLKCFEILLLLLVVIVVVVVVVVVLLVVVVVVVIVRVVGLVVVYLFIFILPLGSSRDQCLPFVVAGQVVGIVRPDIVKELRAFPSVFCIKESPKSGVYLIPETMTEAERTDVVAGVLWELRQKNVLCSLRGWRDEVSLGTYEQCGFLDVILSYFN